MSAADRVTDLPPLTEAEAARVARLAAALDARRAIVPEEPSRPARDAQ